MIHSIYKDDFNSIASQNLPWERLFDKTIFITGANGFLSSYIIKFLLYLSDLNKRNIRVIGLTRNKKQTLAKFKDEYKDSRIRFIFQDVSSSISLRETIHWMIHAASQASPKMFGIAPVDTIKANTLGTYNMLELAKKNPIEGFLYISSGEIYGNPLVKKAIKENDYGYIDLSKIRSCYAESKRMGELMSVSWHHEFKIPTKIVRLFHTYGPGVRLDDGRVFADFVANVIRDQNIIMKSEGNDIRSFCYIADTIAGFFTALFKGKNGEAYNVGNRSATVSIKQLASILAGLFPNKKLKILMKKRSSTDKYLISKFTSPFPNTSKLELLGWKPKFNLTEGFKRTIESFSKE